jgi:MFS family permease
LWSAGKNLKDRVRKVASGELAAVMAIMALGALAMSILRPMLPIYLDDIGVQPTVLGLMFSAAMVGMVLGESSWGWVADRVGLRLPMTVGTAVCGIVVLSFVLTQAVAGLFAVFFVWGVVRSAIYGPGRGYIAAKAPPLRKSTYMAIVAAILATSRSLGALPGGFIVDSLGFNWLFAISAGIALVGGIVVMASLKRGTRAFTGEPAGSDPVPGAVATTLPVRSLRRTFGLQCAVAALQFLALGIVMTFAPLLATQVIGVSATEVGVLFTVAGLMAMVAVPLGMLADRIGKRAFMMLGLFATAAAMAGMAFADSYAWLFVYAIVQAVGMATFSPAALGLLSDSIPADRQATAMGVYGGLCENSGVIAGSALGGLLWDQLGPGATFLAGTAAAGLGVLLCLGLSRGKVTGGARPAEDCGC